MIWRNLTCCEVRATENMRVRKVWCHVTRVMKWIQTWGCKFTVFTETLRTQVFEATLIVCFFPPMWVSPFFHQMWKEIMHGQMYVKTERIITDSTINRMVCNCHVRRPFSNTWKRICTILRYLRLNVKLIYIHIFSIHVCVFFPSMCQWSCVCFPHW